MRQEFDGQSIFLPAEELLLCVCVCDFIGHDEAKK